MPLKTVKFNACTSWGKVQCCGRREGRVMEVIMARRNRINSQDSLWYSILLLMTSMTKHILSPQIQNFFVIPSRPNAKKKNLIKSCWIYGILFAQPLNSFLFFNFVSQRCGIIDMGASPPPSHIALLPPRLLMLYFSSHLRKYLDINIAPLSSDFTQHKPLPSIAEWKQFLYFSLRKDLRLAQNVVIANDCRNCKKISPDKLVGRSEVRRNKYSNDFCSLHSVETCYFNFAQ